jgi:hypothetical protein
MTTTRGIRGIRGIVTPMAFPRPAGAPRPPFNDKLGKVACEWRLQQSETSLLRG